MTSAFLSLLPMIVGAALAPVWLIITLLLLGGERGLAKAVSFVAGMTVARLVQGVLFGWVFVSYASDHAEEEEATVVAVLLLILGLVLLVSAARKWLKGADPDEPPPQWMTSLSDWSVLRAFGVGVAGMAIAAKQWVFTLSAIGVIGVTATTVAQEAGLFVVYVIGAQSLLLLALVYAAVAPVQSAKTLDAAQRWLERNNRPIVIAVSLIFGLYFSWKGITGLLG